MDFRILASFRILGRRNPVSTSTLPLLPLLCHGPPAPTAVVAVAVAAGGALLVLLCLGPDTASAAVVDVVASVLETCNGNDDDDNDKTFCCWSSLAKVTDRCDCCLSCDEGKGGTWSLSSVSFIDDESREEDDDDDDDEEDSLSDMSSSSWCAPAAAAAAAESLSSISCTLCLK